MVGGKMVIELLAGTMRRGRGGIAAVEDDMRQTYTVKHIRKRLWAHPLGDDSREKLSTPSITS